jgi:hypothetical protein
VNTQQQRLLKQLKRGHWLGNLSAWRLCGVYAFSQRIGDLRRAGVKLVSRWKRVQNSDGSESRVKEWRLA